MPCELSFDFRGRKMSSSDVSDLGILKEVTTVSFEDGQRVIFHMVAGSSWW